MAELTWPALAVGVVALRPWRAADVPSLLDAFSDAVFIRFNDWAPTTEADAHAYIAADTVLFGLLATDPK